MTPICFEVSNLIADTHRDSDRNRNAGTDIDTDTDTDTDTAIDIHRDT